MKSAVWAEATKLRRSPVGKIATVAIVGGIAAICGGILLAVRGGNEMAVAQLGPYADDTWTGIAGASAQITGAGAFIGFGIVLAWMFGREFAEGTITGLFGLPVSRARIAAAKLLVYLVWATMVAVALAGCLLLLGIVLGLGPLDTDVWEALAKQVALGVLTANLALPVAWLASQTRSLLAAVAGVIGLVAVTQIAIYAGAGAWIPMAAPTLWALPDGAALLPTVSPLQLGLSVMWGFLGAGATVFVWRRLQLDR